MDRGPGCSRVLFLFASLQAGATIRFCRCARSSLPVPRSAGPGAALSSALGQDTLLARSSCFSCSACALDTSLPTQYPPRSPSRPIAPLPPIPYFSIFSTKLPFRLFVAPLSIDTFYATSTSTSPSPVPSSCSQNTMSNANVQYSHEASYSSHPSPTLPTTRIPTLTNFSNCPTLQPKSIPIPFRTTYATHHNFSILLLSCLCFCFWLLDEGFSFDCLLAYAMLFHDVVCLGPKTFFFTFLLLKGG